MLRIAICDDSETDRAAACRGVEEYLAAHRALNGRVDVFAEPSALLDAMEGGAAWDIALLDVYMPGMLGTEVARDLSAKQKELGVIFLTTSSDFAVEAFALGAVHYLVKPFTGPELAAALDRAVEPFLRRERKSLLLHTEKGAPRQVFLGEITYIESAGHSRTVHTLRGDMEERQQSLAALFDQLRALSPGQFISPYRGYVVNQDAIRTISARGILLHGGETVPLKEGDFRKTRNAYFQWAFRREGEE